MSLVHEIISKSVKTRDMDSLNKALHIVFPDRMENKELIIHEYDGSLPRLFGDDSHIELMLPEDMDTIVENAVVDAIENGTLFDDAEKVNNTAAYITMAHYPLTGIANKGLGEPHAIKHAIGSVVGAMNSEGRFGNDEVDINNGINFAHDIVDHGNRDNVNELVGSYLDAKESNNLPLAFKKSTRKIADEVEDIKSVKPEDTITSADIDNGFSNGKAEVDDIDDDDVETKKECGDVEECGTVDTFDEDGDWASNIMSHVKKSPERAKVDAELDGIIAKNKQDQEDMQKRVADMRARVMARRNKSVEECGSQCVEEEDDIPDTDVDTGDVETVDETGEAEAKPGESWNKPTSGITESHVDRTYEEYVTESFLRRPKKLKPIPRDVVAYITVEINAMRDANDQAMLASYTCSKLELVDFYITCIDTKDERYIVPHTRQYLVQMQDDLNRLLTRILQIRPVNRNDTRWKAILPEGRY